MQHNYNINCRIQKKIRIASEGIRVKIKSTQNIRLTVILMTGVLELAFSDTVAVYDAWENTGALSFSSMRYMLMKASVERFSGVFVSLAII